LKVKRTNRRPTLSVTTDGEGLVSHAGTAVLGELADKVGLTRALSRAMEPTRKRRSAHDPGEVLVDLAVMLADGGDSLADMDVLRDQPDLFGRVASGPTAWRVVDSVDDAGLARLRAARKASRAQAWAMGAKPKTITLDMDATLVTAYSEKDQAAGNYKHGFGFHPMLCYLDETDEGLAGKLRSGNAGATTTRSGPSSR
jgi:Transposase DDE domain group 1